MRRNFEISDGIYLVQGAIELDLHNNFDFKGLNYSLCDRKIILYWERSRGDWVSENTPKELSIEFSGVSEFRFLPRDPELPFTEDDCVNSFGYWIDEDWAEGVVIVNKNQQIESQWLTGIDFMSGAVVALQAETAHAKIVA